MESAVSAGAAVARSAVVLGVSATDPRSVAANYFAAVPHRYAEIDCLRGVIPTDVIQASERRAAVLGVGADRVLIGTGAIDEESYLHALAEALDMPFEPLDDVARTSCPLPDKRLIEVAAAGILPLKDDNGLYFVVAPRGAAAHKFAREHAVGRKLPQRFHLTTAERLNRFVLRHGGKAISEHAERELGRFHPTLSAAPPRWRGHAVRALFAAAFAVAAVIMAPGLSRLVVDVTLASVFLAWLAFRLSVALIARRLVKPQHSLADDALPVYTIISALYREAASLDGLLTAIERLNYPPEKLDVIVAVEADDNDTRAAIAARRHRLRITVIPVPAGGPRTKPKALNVALPFARGAFTVIYDAEDRPEPNQLRDTLRMFGSADSNLACVQARLSIDNTDDGWLPRLFTAEYAGQFDVFLPGLAALALPLPLGGSSNHFDTAALRAVHGWDAYNVTEDADLGMRLARFGYRSAVIESTTYEEAPAQLVPWLRQRTRWFKGWMQTWAVHMRQPRRLMRDLGAAGFLSFQLIVGGNALAALVHPLFIAGLAYNALSAAPMWQEDNVINSLLLALYGTTIAAGYLTSVFLGWLGLKRRGLLASSWVLLLTPLHWLLLSLAAWRALYQLVVSPYAWEKTTHGLAKSSRLEKRTTRSLLKLERQIRRLKSSGTLPEFSDDKLAGRRRRMRERPLRRKFIHARQASPVQ